MFQFSNKPSFVIPPTYRIFSLLGILSAVVFLTPLHSQELQKIGHLSYAPHSLAGCWHHVDNTGGEWALVGTQAGMSIVDVNDPTQPVERFFVPGITNNWREVSTWAGYAYVGSEAAQSGVTIVDLRQLPDTIRWKVWRGDGVYDSLVVKSHTLKAADGYLYIFGGASVTNGALIANLSDPWNPTIVGLYTNAYVHDGFIHGDTMWTSEIYLGQFGVVDVSDKTNPILLATQPTVGAFNHNTWLSEDGQTIFTADESLAAPLGAYNVSNLDNITLLDTYQPSRKPQGEVHNVRGLHNFLVNACYQGQLTIVDATRPDNLIETAWDSLGNSLVWDADPYLPSGIILATAKAEGLFIYKKPSYQHAAWLEGTVTNGSNGLPIPLAKIQIQDTLHSEFSGVNGSYKTGKANPGLYNVTAYREGYFPKTIMGVSLQTNQVTNLDITLFPILGAHSPENAPHLSASPSPFTDCLTIELDGESPLNGQETTLQLFDFSGKMVAQQVQIGSSPLKFTGLQQLPSGVYWLMMCDGKTVAGVRVVK